MYKAGIWAAALVFLGLLGFHWLSIALFLLVTAGIFFSLPSGRGDFWAAYWVFAVSSGLLLVLQITTSLPILSSPWVSFVLVLLSALTFFFILELMDYSFINQYLGFSLVNTGVLIFLFLSSLALAAPFSLSAVGIFLFLALSLLFREIFLFSGVSRKRALILGMVLGLLGIELAWITLSLPLGILNGAALLTLFFVIIREFLTTHFRGTMTTAFVFRQFTFLVLFMIVILAASRWSL